jgi:hypothetical protein
MIKEFTYQIPDDLYVEGITGNKTVTYTYDGPEKFSVLVNSDGIVYEVDPNPDELTSKSLEELVEIDANKTPEVAYFFGHFLLKTFEHEYEFNEEVMDNGDIYRFPKNPILWDVYYVLYNRDSSEWEFKQVLKDKVKPGENTIRVRLNIINRYLETYEFLPEVEGEILKYVNTLNEYISNCTAICEWKYTNLPKPNIPKIPALVASEFNKLPGENLE